MTAGVVVLKHVVGVIVSRPHPVWHWIHSVTVGHTVVVVGSTVMLVQPHGRVTNAGGGHDTYISTSIQITRYSPLHLGVTERQKEKTIKTTKSKEMKGRRINHVPSAMQIATVLQVVGQPVVAVLVAVGRKVQDSGRPSRA